MNRASISALFIQQILEGANAQGLDAAPILRRYGLSDRSLASTQNRVSVKTFAQLSADMMAALDDEHLGLCTKPQRLGSFNMAARACISASTLKRSLKRWARFWNLFENTFEHSVLVSSGRLFYQLEYRDGQAPLNTYAVDAALSTAHRFHCWLTGQFLPLKRVSLPYEEPGYKNETQRLFYGAPLAYSAKTALLEFDDRFTDVELVQDNAALETYLAAPNLALFYQPKNYRAVEDQVRQWLQKNLVHGNYHCSLARAADQLKLSQQVLHRRLQSESTSFKQIKMQARRDLAINLLGKERHRVEEIAARVGFSEPSAFIRAFKSWTGTTPLLFRQHQFDLDQD